MYTLRERGRPKDSRFWTEISCMVLLQATTVHTVCVYTPTLHGATASVPREQRPTWRSLELEVPKVRHNDGVLQGLGPRVLQQQLRAPRVQLLVRFKRGVNAGASQHDGLELCAYLHSRGVPQIV